MFIVEYFKENQYNAFSEPLIAFKNTKNNHFYYYFFKSILLLKQKTWTGIWKTS